MKPKDESIFYIGMLSLVLSVVFEYLDLQYSNISISSFLGGLFAGLFIVLVFFYIRKVKPALVKEP